MEAETHRDFWLTWWLGMTRVSATTTFSRRVAVKTITSATSSGVKGSQPLWPVKTNSKHNGKKHMKNVSFVKDSDFEVAARCFTCRRHRPSPCHHYIEREKIPRWRSQAQPNETTITAAWLPSPYRLHLTGIDLDDPDFGGDELLPQALGKAANGGLGGAVN